MELGKVGLNVNGDISEEIVADRSAIADRLGIPIWIGELDCLDPFETAKIVAEHTSTPITIFCSPSRRNCNEIKSRLIDLKRKYDNDIILTLVPGRSRKISYLVDCLRWLKDELNVPILVGCSGERLMAIASKFADGLVLNYCDLRPTGVFTACYVASLIMPSRLYNELILSSAAMLSNKLKLNVDFKYIVKNRDCLKIPKEIAEISKILVDHTISGSVDEVTKKIVRVLNICDHVILGTPFFRDDRSIKSLKTIVNLVESIGGLI
ncbi:MAG: hypothetical protein DSY33_00320 [Archaeoglobus sp.]|nr:MAG: hypothetical protein DSY33_00320 [Archaeoglobus sp.]